MPALPVSIPEKLRALIHLHWGIQTLRPLQDEAMQAVLDGRDSLVVMPTGGGKSLCYQAPPLVRGEMTVVVSPLIALMKDQVDGLARPACRPSRLTAVNRRRIVNWRRPTFNGAPYDCCSCRRSG